jgi:hypothetical protein
MTLTAGSSTNVRTKKRARSSRRRARRAGRCTRGPWFGSPLIGGERRAWIRAYVDARGRACSPRARVPVSRSFPLARSSCRSRPSRRRARGPARPGSSQARVRPAGAVPREVRGGGPPAAGRGRAPAEGARRSPAGRCTRSSQRDVKAGRGDIKMPSSSTPRIAPTKRRGIKFSSRRAAARDLREFRSYDASRHDPNDTRFVRIRAK